ncbi:hypothetical protein MARLIPOL_11661 [Marinobacter lipolyticus SM19]|uniref:Uncharacterized protein n=1 Tax=Marinobacter lipolyticus SM19 TaxID=1318628 RepID=R8B136_9GAMM|nr:hypothetical protein [Marinobacter lipolyticus]EON92277.1 hypothetical protein MARLIPOL_11661 [Marinobacter lipolyticus SM19]
MSRFLVPVAVLLELIALCISSPHLSALAGVLFVLYFLFALWRLQAYSRYLFLISLLAIGYLGVVGQLDSGDLMRAASNAAFYAAFLGSLGMMQCLVRRLEVLQRIHDVLLGGRPALLYPKYAVVSCGIASVLSFGVMNLLCGTLADTLGQRGITGVSRLRWLRSVLISTLRGFALVPLVAPTSVAVAIITREVPTLSWSGLLPYGIGSAILLVLVGWVLEYKRFRLVSSERKPLETWPAGSGRLLPLVLIIFTAMGVLVQFTALKVSVAAMLTVPVVTLLYMLWHDRSATEVAREAADNMLGMSNEMSIFAGSAGLGVALVGVIPADALAGMASGELGVLVLAVCGSLMMPLLSAVGIIPITVLSVQAGLMPQLVTEGVDPLPVAVALVIGFSLAMMLSPFGPAVMLLSRFGQVSRWVVAFGWNGVFVLLSLPLLLVMLWGVFAMAPAMG